MDDLLTQFLIEGRDLAADAQEALRALAHDPADRAAIDALFRAVHTLKGSVALFEMAPAEAVMHAAETALAAVRRDGRRLEPAERDALVAIVDQIDRWIDAMETQGRLAADAGPISRRLIAALAAQDPEEAAPPDEIPAWLEALCARPGFVARLPARGGSAFRYAPDGECFFRGEDPLAAVAAVPDLLAIAILPAADAWPALEAIDPFRCFGIIEGISGASESAVRTAFRLVPDQVETCALVQADTAERAAEIPAEGASAMLRIDGRKLDRLARQAGELAVAIHGLDDLARRADAIDRSLAGEIRRAQTAIEAAGGALRASVAEVRLVSLAPILRRLPRLAREVAAALGKEVEFTIAGAATEADKQIADMLFEPLLHLVRNAIDHGIEPAEERSAAGKPARGSVALGIAPAGDRLQITLRDDGRGIDPARMREAAVAKRLLDPEAAAALDDARALRLIFLPGFSTAETVSDISGRGVGMDAVGMAIDRLQGSIEIESTVGSGTMLRIALPLNAITTPLLTVRAGGGNYGLRLDQVSEILRRDRAEIHAVGQGKACVIRDRTVPVLDLGTLLGRAAADTEPARLVLTEVTGEPVALEVEVLGQRIDAMVRARGGLLAALPAISGTAVLADGEVLLVLDLQELAG